MKEQQILTEQPTLARKQAKVQGTLIIFGRTLGSDEVGCCFRGGVFTWKHILILIAKRSKAKWEKGQ